MNGALIRFQRSLFPRFFPGNPGIGISGLIGELSERGFLCPLVVYRDGPSLYPSLEYLLGTLRESGRRYKAAAVAGEDLDGAIGLKLAYFAGNCDSVIAFGNGALTSAKAACALVSDAEAVPYAVLDGRIRRKRRPYLAFVYGAVPPGESYLGLGKIASRRGDLFQYSRFLRPDYCCLEPGLCRHEAESVPLYLLLLFSDLVESVALLRFGKPKAACLDGVGLFFRNARPYMLDYASFEAASNMQKASLIASYGLYAAGIGPAGCLSMAVSKLFGAPAGEPLVYLLPAYLRHVYARDRKVLADLFDAAQLSGEKDAGRKADGFIRASSELLSSICPGVRRPEFGDREKASLIDAALRLRRGPIGPRGLKRSDLADILNAV